MAAWSSANPDAEIGGKTVVRAPEFLEDARDEIESRDSSPLKEWRKYSRSKRQKKHIQGSKETGDAVAFGENFNGIEISQDETQSGWEKTPVFLFVVANENGWGAEEGDATLAKNAVDFGGGEARVGEIFEDLGADGEVKLAVSKRERLADRGDVHQRRELGIDCDVLTDASSEKSAIGLKAAADVEYGEVALRQTIEAVLEDAAASAEY
jgi:hypothetical protein